MRSVGILGLTLLLGGCALPPIVTALSFALDGVSFVATGKSVGDHGLSVVLDRDCALWRVIDGRGVCEAPDGEMVATGDRKPDAEAGDPNPGAETIAVVALVAPVEDVLELATPIDEPAPSSAAPAIGATAAATPVEPVAPRVRAVGRTASVKTPPKTATDNSEQRFLVIASLADRGDAQRLAGRYRDLGAAVRMAQVNGHTTHRVVIGPFAPDNLGTARRQAEMRGATGVWPIKPCAAGDLGRRCAGTAVALVAGRSVV
ncbi:MAG: SPOR domain-containing protein [Alphaproteobacteria bacterium]|nr:SPOR domain-containing protein [Alphaproteobacteria bacterium]